MTQPTEPQDHDDRVDIRYYFESKLRDMEARFEQRFTEKDLRDQQRHDEKDLRDQQRYDAQTTAVNTAMLAQTVAMQAALAAAEKAVGKAEVAAEKRFDATNEFREQLRDQAGTLMPRSESEARLLNVVEKIETLRITQDLKTTDLAKRLDQMQGTYTGKQQSWGILVSVIVATGVIVGILARFL